jgi:hypothetical protein
VSFSRRNLFGASRAWKNFTQNFATQILSHAAYAGEKTALRSLLLAPFLEKRKRL